jgi:hypothetical protein
MLLNVRHSRRGRLGCLRQRLQFVSSFLLRPGTERDASYGAVANSNALRRWHSVLRLVELARQFDALIEIECAVGDTIVDDTKVLQIEAHWNRSPRPVCGGLFIWPTSALLNKIRNILFDCWWTSRSRRSHLPSMIRRQPFRQSTNWRTCCVALAGAVWQMFARGTIRVSCACFIPRRIGGFFKP